jgi:hypothetical protein
MPVLVGETVTENSAGAGESGKSTVLKQMRIINAGGFNKTERKQWRAIIFNNLVSAFQTIFAAMQEQETDFEDDDNLVRSFEPNGGCLLTFAAFC